MGLGYVGAPLALSISRWLGVVALVAVMKWTGVHRTTWFGFSVKELVDWREMKKFLKLGVPACVSLLAEMLGVEALTGVACRLGHGITYPYLPRPSSQSSTPYLALAPKYAQSAFLANAK